MSFETGNSSSSQPPREPPGVLQAAGHKDTIKEDADDKDFLMKPFNQTEADAYESVWSRGDDPIQRFVPRFGGVVSVEESPGSVQQFMRIQNALVGFESSVNVMDCKVGVRTFDESEALGKKMREDLYKKVMKIAPEMLSTDEHDVKACTKFKYMTARDSVSSSRSLGFRIQGICGRGGELVATEDCQKAMNVDQLVPLMMRSLPKSGKEQEDDTEHVRTKLVRQLLQQIALLADAMAHSPFIMSHEIIGASLLFVMDENQAIVRFIDFAKTKTLPESTCIDHRTQWELGNHEDGILVGVDSLQVCWEEVLNKLREHCPDSYETAGKEREKQLASELASHGVDPTCLQYNGKCGLAVLDWEIHIHKSMSLEVTDDGGIQRVVNLVRFWVVAEVCGESLVLMERKEQRKRNEYYPGHIHGSGVSLRPPARKILMGETWEDTVERSFEEWFGISPDLKNACFQISSANQRMNSEEAVGNGKDGYTGLRTVYRSREVDVIVTEPESDKLEMVGLPGGRNFAAVETGESVNSLFGSGLRHWTWAPLHETVAGFAVSTLKVAAR